jgi:hypothetical protein
MPLAQEIAIAPKSGIQPWKSKSWTLLLRLTRRTHIVAEIIVSIQQMRGMGVLMTRMRIEEMAPRRLSVRRSPRPDAIGGAILSGNVKNKC